jgi:hypothetical protein
MRQQVTLTVDPELYQAFTQRCHQLRYTRSQEFDRMIKQWLKDHPFVPETPVSEQPAQVSEVDDFHEHRCPFCGTYYDDDCDDDELDKDCEQEECLRER